MPSLVILDDTYGWIQYWFFPPIKYIEVENE